MKHLDITKPNKDGLAKFMVTVQGNSFGDQILILKQYSFHKEDGLIVSQYVVIKADCNPEGEHLSDTKIKQWAKQFIKVKVKV